jgi:hypothetical protein
MGFFSWDCKGCTHSVREGSPADWMTKAAVLTEEGSRVVGSYDGYGRVGEGEAEVQNMTKPEVWHHACWVAAGKPEYTGPSPSARDQGMTDYDVARPRHMQDVEALREVKQTMLREMREKTKRVWTEEVQKMRDEGREVPDYALRLAEHGDN